MNRDRVKILMNRVIDGEACANEREDLSRAMSADPLLKEEYGQLQLVHRATESLFNEIRLPSNFSSKIMSSLQPHSITSDVSADSARYPSVRQRIPHAAPARSNVFTVVASIAAAAAVILTVGILLATYGTSTNQDSLVSDEVQDVPGNSGNHRTDPLTSVPKRGDDSGNPESSHEPSETVVKDGSSDDNNNSHKNEPDNGADSEAVLPREEVIEKDDSGSRENPDQPELPVELPKSPVSPEDKGPVIEKDAPQPDRPEGIIEREDTPENDHKTESAPDNRRTIGRLTKLSGRVQVMKNGSWQPLEDLSDVRENSRLKTSTNGVVLLELENGRVTLGKGTEIHLIDENSLEIIEGEVSLSRNKHDALGTLSVISKDLTWTQQAGISVIEQKRRGLEVQNVLGNGLLFNQDNGLLEVTDGYVVRADHDKAIEAGKAKRLLLPDWSADSRAVYLSNELELAIESRIYSSKQLNYLNKNLVKNLSRLLRQPIPGDSLFDALEVCIQNQALEGSDIIKVVREIENAVHEHSEIGLSTLNIYAMDAGQTADSFANWQILFQDRITPPVKGNPPKIPNGTGTNKPAPT